VGDDDISSVGNLFPFGANLLAAVAHEMPVEKRGRSLKIALPLDAKCGNIGLLPHAPTSIDSTMTGYHGCNSANVPGIMANNFKTSTGDHHWLGEGTYFFGAGISNPLEDAKQWAIAESWDNTNQTRFYRTFTVLKAAIQARNALDMTKDDGKAKVNIARTAIHKRMRSVGGYHDTEIVRWLAGKFGFDVLIQDFYIKFSDTRRLRIQSRFPNVRVICVRDPVSAIDKDKIEVTYTALIP